MTINFALGDGALPAKRKPLVLLEGNKFVGKLDAVHNIYTVGVPCCSSCVVL